MVTTKILAIIPARGGSKGIKHKNITNLGGKPLIAWSIEASLQSKYITRTVVSSDSDEILTIAKKFGSEAIKRPKQLATDTATSESTILHVVEKLQQSGDIFDYIILLQPTSPLRDAVDIDAAFQQFFTSKATALISGNEVDNKFLKVFHTDKQGFIQKSLSKFLFIRRQELPKIYLSNGAIYIIKTSEFCENKTLLTDKTILFNMDDNKSIDIDNQQDLALANSLVTNGSFCINRDD